MRESNALPTLLLTVVALASPALARVAEALPYEYQTIADAAELPSATRALAFGINDDGVIVGDFAENTTAAIFVRTAAGAFEIIRDADIDAGLGGGVVALGNAGISAINNAGVLVGGFRRLENAALGSGFVRGPNLLFARIDVCGPAPHLPAGVCSPTTIPRDINNLGVVVGTYQDLSGPPGLEHGFVLHLNDSLDPSQWAFDYFEPIVDGQFFGPFDVSITDANELFGSFVDVSGLSHGFVTEGGEFKRFDCKDASITTLNGGSGAGQIVGGFGTNDPIAPERTPFLKIGNECVPLAPPQHPAAGVFTTAMDINAHGVIAGVFRESAGFNPQNPDLSDRAFRALPVPAPPGLLLLASAAAALSSIRWGRDRRRMKRHASGGTKRKAISSRSTTP